MRRRLWVPLCSPQWAGRCRGVNFIADAPDSAEECEGAGDVALQRLVHSLGFELRDMDQLVRSLATGEKPPAGASEKNSSTPRTRLADACMKLPVLLPLFCKVAIGRQGLSAPSASDGTAAGSLMNRESGNCEVAALLHRCALRTEANLHTRQVKHLSEIELRGGALATLSLALWESLRVLRREGKRRWRDLGEGGTAETNQLHAWRYDGLKMHVEAFASLDDTCRSVFGMTVEAGPGKPGDAACRQTLCLCATTVISMTVSVADELHWHFSRPSVRQRGGKEVLLLERRVNDCVASIWSAAHAFLAGVVEGATPFAEGAEHVSQLSPVLFAVECLLAVMEGSSNLPCSGEVPDGGCAFAPMVMWLLLTASSLPHAPPLKLERRFVSCLQQLWQKMAPPLERSSNDKVMTHRTVHASLNLRYAHLRGELQVGEGDKFFELNPEKSLLLLRLLERIVSKFAAWQGNGATATASMVMPHAVLCRTVLEMEVEIYFAACKKTGRELTIPTDISRAGVGARRAGAAADVQWEAVLQAASSLRVAVSSLVHTYLRMYASHDTSAVTQVYEEKGDVSFIECSVYRFVRGISTSFFPLLRRHYIDSAGTAVLTSSLHCFLALKQVSDLMDGDGEERRRGVKSAFRVCGVSLSQATEVAFFLSLYRRDHQSLLGGGLGGSVDAIDGSVVSSYVKEVLFALDHNTAKQLWHLRSKKVLRCFTGMSCAGELADERQERRQAQSILSVVHAHVLHPSFLWMPLFQLQEMVFVLCQNRELTEGLQQRLKSSDADDAAASALVRVGSVGGTLRHFGRALGYVALRLYVVTNVLRCYRDGLRREERPARLPSGEASSPAKQQRVWARNMARTLHKSFPGLAAEVEGLDRTRRTHLKRANHCILARLEATCLLAVRHSLLFHVKKQRRRRSAKKTMQRLMDADAATDGSVGAATQSEGAAVVDTLTIHAKRSSATTPLGFSLYGERPAIRRLSGLDHRAGPDDGSTGKNANDTPFSVALRAAGVGEPCSVVGWRVVQIDGTEVTNSRDVVALLRGKHVFSMTLAPPA
ncbi:uncharacterized protein Tco025E_02332 [Trypanosoma conorhini]|uniref:Uncharacterized protein n=1 Tax=Trypanosoma conorhini TaxID=83891 RepID=A0A422Q566_9TRYP|nr:uncharacterized protein Tco025E_02332 [Trypanosoma conorhini]RNF25099.1 hypothetical protein Tco025E_02332 [Trypanosoma conorhini]